MPRKPARRPLRKPSKNRPEPDSSRRPAISEPGAALEGRRIVLGVCGGIAAYKAVEVCRRLVDLGAFVSRS